MTRLHHLARLELHAYRCGTQLAGGFRHRVLAQTCGDAERVDCAPCPEWPTAECQAMLARCKKYEAIMVVGHNPSFAECLSKTVSEGASAAQIEFKKGAVAKVELNGRAGTLQWLVTPKIARTLQTSLKSSSRPKTSRK